MTDTFYARLESHFRGNREVIKNRHALYLPLLASLKQIFTPPTLLDLGCGRGEWLEVAQEAGWETFGVDLDEGMLAEAASQGLHGLKGDLLEYLQGQAAESLCLVTAFHVAEHLSFSDLLTLVQQIYRVLRPGGIMILETPNSENLVVGTSSFYLDPSHRKPLPSELLTFLAIDSGFVRVSISRLHEPPDFSPAALSMQGLLYGISPDYALIAQKAAPEFILGLFPWPLMKDNGCSLFDGVAAYDRSLHKHLSQIDDSIATVALKQAKDLSRLDASIDTVARKQEKDFSQIDEAIDLLNRRMNLLSVCQRELQGVYASKSWRLTAPLRAFNVLVGKWRSLLVRGCRSALLSGSTFAAGHPKLKAGILFLLDRIPGLRKLQLRLLATPSPSPLVGAQASLSPAELVIYHELKDAIMRRRNGVSR